MADKVEWAKITLTVHYKSNRSSGLNDFNNLQELKRWLDAHPEIAAHLGYVKKSS